MTNHFVDFGKWESVQYLSKKYLTLSQLELVKVFNFSDKIPSFVKTMEL